MGKGLKGGIKRGRKERGERGREEEGTEEEKERRGGGKTREDRWREADRGSGKGQKEEREGGRERRRVQRKREGVGALRGSALFDQTPPVPPCKK